MKCKVVSFTAPPELFKDITDKSDILFSGNKTKYLVHVLTQKRQHIEVNNDIKIEKVELYKLIKEVNKIGNNINQIARRTNLGFRKDEPLKDSLLETQKKLDEAITLMNSIIQSNNPNFR